MKFKKLCTWTNRILDQIIEVILSLIFVICGIFFFFWSLISLRRDGLRSKYFREFFEKWISHIIILSLFVLLGVMGYYFVRELIQHQGCLEQYATTVTRATGYFLRIFGAILLVMAIFEFLRRVREYLPLSRPAPRSLLASFGIVVLTSLMAAILIFVNIPDLLSGDKPLNLLFLGIVLGIGTFSLYLVYSRLPHVISKIWVTISPVEPMDDTDIFYEIIVSFLIKEISFLVKEKENLTKAIKIEILGWERTEFEKGTDNAIKRIPSDSEVSPDIGFKKPRIDVNYAASCIIPISEPNLYSYILRVKIIKLGDVCWLRKLIEKHKGIYINLEDENGREISVRKRIDEAPS